MKEISLINVYKVFGMGVAGGFVMVTGSLLIAFVINRLYRIIQR